MARYADAIFWITANDDTEFLDDPSGSLSVTACLVADLFQKDDKQVRSDLIRERTKQGRPVVSVSENF
jgi:hypothetical protein